MFHPSGHSPDEAGIEMSGHILSAGGGGGTGFKQQTITLQATGPQPAQCIFVFLSISLPLCSPSPQLWVSSKLSSISTTWFSSVPKSFLEADQMSLSGPQKDEIWCKVTDLAYIRWHLKPSICLFLPSIASALEDNCSHFSQIIHIFSSLIATEDVILMSLSITLEGAPC